MTASDWKSVEKAYKAKYGSDLATDQAQYEKEKKQAKESQAQSAKLKADNAAALAIVNKTLNRGAQAPGKKGGARHNAKQGNIVSAVNALNKHIESMTKQLLPDNSAKIPGGAKLDANGPGTTTKHYLGIPHSMFDMDRRWNRISANPSYAITSQVDEKKDGMKFREALSNYSDKVARRINFLRENNMLNFKTLSEGATNINLIGNAGLGDQYVTIRIDQLVARLAMVRNVFDVFPRLGGVQDREVMTNAFFGDFSQSYQEGGVFKGTITLEPEIGYVDDAMMKTLFKSMKWLEREYIGYLNKEGSDPIKWSMIEWALLNISTKLIIEQNERKILGAYIKPITGVAGHYMNAATGVFYTVIRYYNECKMALVSDSAYSSYNSGTTMVDVVTNMAQELSSKVDGFGQEYECILNENHRSMWLSGIREKYGKDTDFTGPQGDVIPDTQIPIRWVPYFRQMPIVMFQKPGNIQSLELEAGEMHSLSFETEMENVKVWSVWKEGTSAAYVGQPFKTKQEAIDNDFALQQLFMNKPAVELDPDAAVVTVSGDIRMYVTAENTAATAITDIVGAKEGIPYMIETGSATNPQTIAKSDKFSEITEAYTPTTVGDYIMVALRGDKFVELERMVGGIRKINKDIQPNLPGPGGR